MRTKHLIYIPFLLLLLLSSCIKDGDSNPYEVINYVEEGDKVPSFTVSTGEGGTFGSSELVGKRSLLVLFNTECPDCNKVLPDINNRVWDALKEHDNYLVICIGRGENTASIHAYWEDKGFSMPAYPDPDREVFSRFANSTIPRLYIVNEEGIIEWMAIEKLNISIDELIRLIKQ